MKDFTPVGDDRSSLTTTQPVVASFLTNNPEKTGARVLFYEFVLGKSRNTETRK